MAAYKLLGYWVSENPTVLQAFQKNAHEWYDLLDQMRELITKTVNSIEHDGELRSVAYWKQVARELGPLHAATQGCLWTFAKEQSCRSLPVPLILPVASIMYTHPLRVLEARIEEATLLITAYIEVCDSRQETHVRQRQAVLKALRAVDTAAQEAVSDGRTELGKASDEQHILLMARKAHQSKQEETAIALSTDEAEMDVQSTLPVVRGPEGEGA